MRKFACVVGSSLVCALFFACSSSDKAASTGGAPEASAPDGSTAANEPETSTSIPDASTGDGSPFNKSATLTDDLERPDPTGGPLKLDVVGTATDITSIACTDMQMCNGQVVSVKAAAGAMGDGTYLATSLAGGPEAPPPRKLRFDFSLALANGDANGAAQVQLVELALTNNAFVFLAAIDGKLVIADQFHDVDDSENTNTVSLADLDAALTWGRYRLFVDLDHATAILEKNGVPFPAFPLRSQITAERPDALRFGVTYTDGGAAVEEDFDNLGLSFF